MQPHEFREAMLEALNKVWTAGHAPRNISQPTWQQLLTGGRKPSVEEFIARLANKMHV